MKTSVFVPDELRTAEVLVIGGGIAGLSAAHLRRDFPTPFACWKQPLIIEGERIFEPHPVTSVAVSG